MSYLDLDRLSSEDDAIRRDIHKLAEEVLRPLSIKVDKMDQGGIELRLVHHCMTLLGR